MFENFQEISFLSWQRVDPESVVGGGRCGVGN